MDEEQPDARKGDADELETGDDEVDAQQLLNAATRAIAAVRHQAAGLIRYRRPVHSDDEQPEENTN